MPGKQKSNWCLPIWRYLYDASCVSCTTKRTICNFKTHLLGSQFSAVILKARLQTHDKKIACLDLSRPVVLCKLRFDTDTVCLFRKLDEKWWKLLVYLSGTLSFSHGFETPIPVQQLEHCHQLLRHKQSQASRYTSSSTCLKTLNTEQFWTSELHLGSNLANALFTPFWCVRVAWNAS